MSWAGRGPRGDDFCFGSDDGRLLLTDSMGRNADKPLKTRTDEAINGVAFIEGRMAVSTRSELVVFSRTEDGSPPRPATVPTGTHGVIASSDGYFIAPLGIAGLMFAKPTLDSRLEVVISNPQGSEFSFYGVTCLQRKSGQTVLACAARKGGVAAMLFNGQDEPRNVRALSFEGLDVVDICPLESCEFEAGVAAVARDGTLILFRDVLTDPKVLTVRYAPIEGTAYRLLNAHGKLFLLTSEGLYVITELLDRFAEGSVGDYDVPILSVPMEAVDANLGGDHWILIVMPDEVLRLDLNLLDQDKPSNVGLDGFQKARGLTMNPHWTERQVKQTNVAVLAGA